MSQRESNPPKAAIWLLRHVRPGSHNQALTGDLVEKFRQGRSHRWFWKQVLIAIAVGVLGEVRQHWPQFTYAIAGGALPAFLWKSVEDAPRILHWSAVPWPWSQFLLELSGQALLALAALPVLAVALVINRSFRWASLLRTGMINLTFITLVHYLLGVLDTFSGLRRPVPGNPYLFTILIMPPSVMELLIFSSFLIAAWFGRRSPRRANERSERAQS
ncbi:MAG TPA: hypothetical protein VNH83_00305 [Bryobacteraceae bacterium]|nr:hypothetical protein [Bryobacteraceae bacterium]